MASIRVILLCILTVASLVLPTGQADSWLLHTQQLTERGAGGSSLQQVILERLQSQPTVKLELFVMSQCPAGVRAEQAVAPLLAEFGDRIEFHLRFIARGDDQGGFLSPRGQAEIDEAIRQVVIAAYYPETAFDYVVARAGDYQSEAWEPAARAVGIDPDLVRLVASSEEGQARFRENIGRARELNIVRSPTLLLDGEEFRGDILPILNGGAVQEPGALGAGGNRWEKVGDTIYEPGALTVPLATFTVTKTADTNDGSCDAMDCSLREAIIAANATMGLDTIMVPAGTYTLTITGANEDAAATGDLDITDSAIIMGSGATSTIIDGGALDHVFQIKSVTSGTVTFNGLTIRNGNTTFQGGGIHNDLSMATVTISNCRISNNVASFRGGGIFSTSVSPGTLTVTSSTLSQNVASNFGGGIAAEGTLVVSNSTLSQNSGTVGGGIWVGFGTATVTNSTLSQNAATAGSAAGIISNAFGSATLVISNSIIANSSSGGNCSGSITSQGHNISDDGSCGFVSAGDMNNTNPLLGPLQNNGGPTQTHALLQCSPAIDAGDATICANSPINNLDQRGVVRPIDGDGDGTAVCDIGAYEAPANSFDTTPPVITCPTSRTVSANASCQASATYSATATDNCDPSPTVTCTPPSGSTFNLGTTTVTCTATDGSGNTSTCNFTVTVQDPTPPVIVCPPNQTVAAGAGCVATVNPGLATATDNCSVMSIVGMRSDGMALNASYPGPVGAGSRTTNIVWTATDGSGNMASCTQMITVTNAAPTANAGADQVADEGATVTLTGSGNDPDPGQTLTYQWTQTGGPAVVLMNANTPTATFVAPESPNLQCVAYTFQLTVTDDCGAMAIDTVVVDVTDTFVLQDERNGNCVVIRLNCSGNAGTYCWRKADGGTVSGPCTIVVSGATMNAQSTAADPNRFQAGADLGRQTGNARLTETRINPRQTSSVVDSNITDSTCACP